MNAAPPSSPWSWRVLALACLLWLGVGTAAWATDGEAGFNQANRLYEEGKFSEAAAAYGQLLQSGNSSAAIYFNRGNAYFKLGQLGRAIVSYRLAERLAPRDPDLRANLQFARTQARGGVTFPADWSGRWLGTLTVNEWTALTAVAFWVTFAVLALGQWRPELGRRWRSTLWSAGLLTILFGAGLAVKFKADYLDTTVVVIAGEVDVRNGPLDESQSAYKIRDGIELKVLDRKENWLQVLDPAQRLGWLREDQVQPLSSASPLPPKA